MSSAEPERDGVEQLIERLLLDARFRAEFRRDPSAACRAAGFEELADELTVEGSAMQTLEVRESRSSLAGVLMAVAAEGVGVAELRGLLGSHGLRGHGRGLAANALRAEGIRPPHGARGALGALSHQVRGAGAGAAAHPAASGAAASAPAASGPAASAPAASAPSAAPPAASGSSPAAAAGAVPIGSSPAGAAPGAVPVGSSPAGAAPGAIALPQTPAPAPVDAVQPSGNGAVQPSGGGAVQPSGGGAAQPSGNGAVDPGQLGGGGSGQPSLTGKISWFGGPNDPTAGNLTASGAPISDPGIAVYNRQTLGGYWQVTMPNGRQAILRQTDIGPAPWTGRKVDFTYSALPQLGYTEQTFPTDATVSATYLGQNPPAGAGAGAGGVLVHENGPPIGAGGNGPPSGSAGNGVVGQGGLPVAPGGAGSAAAASLLANPRVQMPPAVRGLLAQGGGDPRMVSVLASAAANHTLVLGGIESTVEPVHAQAIDIVAVDGQPVGPSNVAARDLITEIAALDPRLRPSEVGTPWPIRSPGFFTDALHQGRLHLGFVSASDYVPPADSSAAGGPSVANVGPVAGVPAAAGVAQAADLALAAEQAPPAVGGAVAPGAVGGVAAAGAPAGSASVAAPAGGASVAAPAELVAQAPAPVVAGDPNFASAKAHAAFEAAKSQLGVRYQWGGSSPQTGFDCSGLMQWAYAKAGVNLPRVAADQFHAGTPIDLQHLREGDLVFFQDSTGYIHHVGMYVGDHKFLEAPHTGDIVKYADLREQYWAQQFAGGRRVTPLAAGGVSGGVAGAAVAGAPVAGPAVAGAAGGVGVPSAAAPAAAPAAAIASGQPAAAIASGQPAAAIASGQPGAPAPAAPRPGTAVFAALERQERTFQRHTQQFLAAVSPDPAASGAAQGAPGAASASVGAPAAAGGAAGAAQPVAGAPAVAQPAAGAAAAQPVAQPADAAGLGAQALAAAPTGGAISVTSSLLTSGQEKFAGRLAELTGLDPRVISAWALAEESGGAARGREAAGNFNWLNIGYFDSGAGAIAFDKSFSDPLSAAEKTAEFLKGKWGGASTGIRAILGSVGQGAPAQINAIANSGWASSGYAGGANLRSTYGELSDIRVSRG